MIILWMKCDPWMFFTGLCRSTNVYKMLQTCILAKRQHGGKHSLHT